MLWCYDMKNDIEIWFEGVCVTTVILAPGACGREVRTCSPTPHFRQIRWIRRKITGGSFLLLFTMFLAHFLRKWSPFFKPHFREFYTFFGKLFFHKTLKNFFHVKYYHFKYLGGALCIALYARKKLWLYEVSIKTFLKKRLGEVKMAIFTRKSADSSPLVARVIFSFHFGTKN